MERFAASDLEGTLSRGEAWRGIGAYLKSHGRAMNHRLFFAAHFPAALLARMGILDKQTFRNQWVADQAQLLKGYSAQELTALAEWVVEHELWPPRRASVIDALANHHAQGCTVILATATYAPLANAFARRLPFDGVAVVSTPLEMAQGRATGNLAAEIGVDAVKAQRVRALVGAGTLVAAYGDTAADAPLLEMSSEPVAVAPDAALAKIAAEKGWRVLPG